MLDEASFEASPAHPVPAKAGAVGAKLAGKLRRNS